MLLHRLSLIVLLALVLTLNNSSYADEPQTTSLSFVLMVNNEEDQFWQLSKNAAFAAAKSLNIELQVINLKNNPLRPMRALSTLLTSNKMPDVVIFSNLKNTGDDILKRLEAHKVKSFVFNDGFAPEQRIGAPGAVFHYWQGQLLSQNQEASRRLTRELIDTALEKLPTPLHIIALEGAPSSYVNRERLLGFYDAANDYGDQVVVEQVFTTHWKRKDARNAVLAAQRRYPEVKLFWAANDEVAISAVDTLIELGQRPGQDVFVVGFDRLPLIEQRFRKQQLVNSYGGHYMSAAWAVVYMFDHFNGFNTEPKSMRLPLSGIGQASGIAFDQQIREGHFNEIDFKVYSKKYSPSLQEYPFLAP